YFWAFIVALVLFSVGGLFAIYEGVEKLIDPHQLDQPGWAVVVLTVAIALEASSFRTAMRETRPQLRGDSILTFVRRSKSPELRVVLAEDTAALAGLAFALVGVVLAWVTGNGRFDAIGSLAVGLLLVVVAVGLAIEMGSLLVGESAAPHDVAAIEQALA